MRFIALVLLLGISHPPPASSDCTSYTNGFKCSGIDNNGVVSSNQSFIEIFDVDLDVNKEFFDNFPNATFLHFDDSFLIFPSSYHPATTASHHLKSLWIMNTIVTNFRGTLNNFDELEEVKVSHTSIDYNVLDKNFFRSNKRIKVLKLIDLELRSIESNAFDNLLELNYIEITKTQLQTLPENIFEFNSKLIFLILSRNSFATVPQVSYPESLQVLRLDENQITRISREDLKELKNLTDLLLNKNSIEHIDEDSFDDLKRIKYVTLASNDLSQISERHFQNMESLRVLDLSYNDVDINMLVKAGIPVIGNVPWSLEDSDYDKGDTFEDPLNSEEEELTGLYIKAVYGSGYETAPEQSVVNIYNDYDDLDAQEFEGSSEGVTSITTNRPAEVPHRNYESDDEDLGGSASGNGHSANEDEPNIVIAGSRRRGFEILLLLGNLLLARALCR